MNGNRKSIRTRLKIIILFISGCSIIAAGGVFTFMAKRDYDVRLERHFEVLTEVIGSQSAGTLEFNDPKSAQEILQSLVNAPLVAGSEILLPGGAPLARYQRAGRAEIPPCPPGGEGLMRVSDGLHVVLPVLNGKERVGTVHLYSDLPESRSQLVSSLQVLGSVLAGAFLLAFVLSTRLERLVTRPILELVGTVRDVAERKDFGVRARPGDDDELGDLIAGFNAMLDQIQERDARLQQAKSDLESRVAERTEDLQQANQVLKAEMENRQVAERARLDMELQLNQSLKLESVGRLAAGVAHEINTPIQFVGDNVRFLQGAMNDLRKLLRGYEDVHASLNGSLPPDARSRLESLRRDTDLDYLEDEIPRALDQSKEGVERVARIVRAMKEFSHPGSAEKTPTDLNRAIETTLTVARNEYKYVADALTDFDPSLPLVPVLPGEFNQVVLNLLVNAAHAIADANQGREGARGRITVSTRLAGDSAVIRISDTGTGIPEHVRPRIFEPFFTTKGVGKGTGQGLALAHGFVVKKHQGSLRFETENGKGTTFIITLPLQEPQPAPKEA